MAEGFGTRDVAGFFHLGRNQEESTYIQGYIFSEWYWETTGNRRVQIFWEWARSRWGFTDNHLCQINVSFWILRETLALREDLWCFREWDRSGESSDRASYQGACNPILNFSIRCHPVHTNTHWSLPPSQAGSDHWSRCTQVRAADYTGKALMSPSGYPSWAEDIDLFLAHPKRACKMIWQIYLLTVAFPMAYHSSSVTSLILAPWYWNVKQNNSGSYSLQRRILPWNQSFVAKQLW